MVIMLNSLETSEHDCPLLNSTTGQVQKAVLQRQGTVDFSDPAGVPDSPLAKGSLGGEKVGMRGGGGGGGREKGGLTPVPEDLEGSNEGEDGEGGREGEGRRYYKKSTNISSSYQSRKSKEEGNCTSLCVCVGGWMHACTLRICFLLYTPYMFLFLALFPVN